jgi:HAD superfamily hydrolase (TIGR01484 family)
LTSAPSTQWRPDLVACDLDGTLLGPEPAFAASTRVGVAALLAAGVPVVICTGRMVGSARPRAALVRFARERGLHVNAYVDDELYVEADDRWTRWTTSYAKVEATIVDDLVPVVERGPTKLVIAADPDEAARIASEVSRRFAGRLRAATSLPHFVEINAAAVSKAAALEWVRTEVLGASSARTVACGDGLNDVDMLHWAALGVAIAEGAEGAREAADLVVSRAELGELLERLAAAPA